MSESNTHKELVIFMAVMLEESGKYLRVFADVPDSTRWERPHKINNFIPDVFANDVKTSRATICEAKTWPDLKNLRSENQIKTFLSHLEKNYENSFFILGVKGNIYADHGKSILKFLSDELFIEKCQIQIYDGCDYWKLEKIEGGKGWHLI